MPPVTEFSFRRPEGAKGYGDAEMTEKKRMQIEYPGILDYLHDAIVYEVTYDLTGKVDRSVALPVKCHPNAGHPDWNGRRLTVRLESIVLFSFRVFGAIAGKEEINSWRAGVSGETESELARLQGLGCDCSGTRFEIVFQSGSVLEGLCHRIAVEEGPACRES